ncbi:MAG: site-specific integrase [Pseudolabrys sp.]
MTKRRAHGDGNIEERGENIFRLRYRVNKKRYRATFRGTLKEARTELRRLLRSGDTGEHVAPDKATLATWAKHWIEIGAPGRKKQKVGERAIERYNQLLRTHVLPTLGEYKLQQIDSAHIDKLYPSLEGKIAPRTARHVHSVLNACLGAAVRTKKLTINPMERTEKVPSPGESDHGIALDDQQLGKLVQGFKDSTLFPIVSVAAFTGARRNEVLALRWTDLNPAEETEKHGIRFKGPKKQSHKRTITIDDDLLALLLAEREKHLRMIAGVPDGLTVNLGLVKLPEGAFPNSSALADLSSVTPLRPRFVTKEFARKARKLGFKTLRLHDLRGTHETMLLDAGVPVHVVAARCGHDPATLLRSYAKRTRKADTSAASVIGNISRTILGK